MRKGRSLLAVALLAVPATGCAGHLGADGAGGWPTEDGVTILAKADGWRDALSTDESMGGFYAIGEIAYDEATARAAWVDAVPADLPDREGEPRESGRYGDLEGIDFDRQVLVVYSSGQSGACPGWVADIAVDDRTVEVTEGRHMPGDGCTDDYNAYRLVLAVDRDRLPPLEDLPTEQVLVDGHDLAAVVAAYPAR